MMARVVSAGLLEDVLSTGAAACQYSVMLAASPATGFSTHFQRFVANQCVSCLLQTSCSCTSYKVSSLPGRRSCFSRQQPGQWLQEEWKTWEKSPQHPQMLELGPWVHPLTSPAAPRDLYWVWTVATLVEQEPPGVVSRPVGWIISIKH